MVAVDAAPSLAIPPAHRLSNRPPKQFLLISFDSQARKLVSEFPVDSQRWETMILRLLCHPSVTRCGRVGREQQEICHQIPISILPTYGLHATCNMSSINRDIWSCHQSTLQYIIRGGRGHLVTVSNRVLSGQERRRTRRSDQD